MILREIIKTVATRCHILELICIKIAQTQLLGELTAIPKPRWNKDHRLLRNGMGAGRRRVSKEVESRGKEEREGKGKKRRRKDPVYIFKFLL